MDIQVSTIAGCAEKGHKDGKAEDAMFNQPTGICISADGKIYISDSLNRRIRMISDCAVSTIAGCGSSGHQDGKAENAIFNGPSGICTSDPDEIYVSDGKIKRISHGMVSTIAGMNTQGFQNGNAKDAMLYNPCGICISDDDKIYIADYNNHRIRMISDDIVSTIAGCSDYGHRDGKAERAEFKNPYGICISPNEKRRIYITDYSDHRIRMISDGVLSTIAGCGSSGFRDGKAENAMFNGPAGICISNDSTIYVSDSKNNCIRMISNGIVSTIAGNGKEGFKDGKAENAMFNKPLGISLSNDGKIYLADSQNHRIRMISGLPIPSTAYFELSSLLLNSKSLSDMTLTINNHQYHLHTAVIHALCPMIVKHISIIEDAKISHESLQTMFEMIYSNNTNKIRKQKDKYEMTDLTHLIELTWLFESFEIKNRSFVTTCIKQFKTEMKYLMKQENSKFTINQSKAGLFSLMLDLIYRTHHMIASSQLHGLQTTNLAQTLDYSIDQLKQYLQEEQNKLKNNTTNNEMATMSVEEMNIVFGLHTEPRVVDQQQIKSETVLKFMQTENDTSADLKFETQPDYTIMTHDKSYSIKCHKLILYAKWPYFRRMIESGLLESASGEMIMSEDWNETRLYDFVRYLYTYNVGFESVEDAVWLLKNAELYGLMEIMQYDNTTPQGAISKEIGSIFGDFSNLGLKIPLPDFQLLIQTCRKKAFQVITPDNCCQMYKVSLEIGTGARRKECYAYLVINVIELMKNDKTREQLLQFGPEFYCKISTEHFQSGIHNKMYKK